MHHEDSAQSGADNDLEIVNYGGGYALLRPERTDQASTRFSLTDRGRRLLAQLAVFGPSPTVAEVHRLRVVDQPRRALCPACGRPQSSQDCATREHWGVD